MKVLFYIGPSVLNYPKANLIQSLCQFNYLRKHFNRNYYINISFLSKSKTKDLISSCSPMEFIPKGILFSFLKINKMNYLFNFFYQSSVITFLFFRYSIFQKFYKVKFEPYFYSRSLLTSFFLSIFKNINHIFEVHGKETNKILQRMQEHIIKNKNVKIVYISKSLKNIYKDNTKFSYILHDSSPYYFDRKSIKLKDKDKNNPIEDQRIKIVYSGSSGEGRGVKLIISLAELLKECTFIVMSNGFPKELPDNVYNLGYQKHKNVLKILEETDFALMPYQDNLSIGNQNINSLEWMSPLKMFDYMNTSTSIVTSYFPVIEEVLKDLDTCYFVYDYSNPKAWYKLISKEIKNGNKKYKSIAKNAKILFEKEFNYEIRSKKIMKLFQE